MFPVIVQLGPMIVYTLWLFAGIGFLASVFVFTHLAKAKRLHMNFIYYYSFPIFIWTIIFARLFFVGKNYLIYFTDFSVNSFLSVLLIWDKGLSLLGALTGLVISLIYFSIKEKEQTKKWLDILCISAMPGLAIGHLGSFFDGSFYGNETDLPWGVLIDNPAIKFAVPIHPVQIYSAIFCALFFGILYIIYKKKRIEKGLTAVWTILIYSVYLILQGFLRGDDVLTLLNIREEQLLGILLVIITGGYLIYSYNKLRKIKSNKTTINTNNTQNGSN